MKKLLFSLFTVFSFCVPSIAQQYSNPVINYSLPDPTVIKADDGYYYLYATENIRNLPIHRSKDMVNWSFVGTAFTNETRPCDIDKIRENALYHVTPDYSISMLDEWRKDNTNICYLAEATPDNSDYINGLLRMRVVDEIILYTVPFISGTGRHFFKSALPEARWTLSSQKSYSNGVYRSIYTRMETMK